MSRTSRFDLQRDTQIIMNSLEARSSSLSTESRWSTSPSTTSVSQVPQTPSMQEPRTLAPASSAASKTLLSDGTVTVTPVCCRTSSKLSSATSDVSCGLAENRSRCRLPEGHPAHLASTAESNPSGPQQYTSVPSCGVPSTPSRSRKPASSCGTTVTRSPYCASSGRNAIDARWRPP